MKKIVEKIRQQNTRCHGDADTVNVNICHLSVYSKNKTVLVLN